VIDGKIIFNVMLKNQSLKQIFLKKWGIDI